MLKQLLIQSLLASAVVTHKVKPRPNHSTPLQDTAAAERRGFGPSTPPSTTAPGPRATSSPFRYTTTDEQGVAYSGTRNTPSSTPVPTSISSTSTNIDESPDKSPGEGPGEIPDKVLDEVLEGKPDENPSLTTSAESATTTSSSATMHMLYAGHIAIGIMAVIGLLVLL